MRLLCLICCLFAFGTAPALAAEKARVVATFSILGDLTRRVGGEAIELVTLAGPDEDAHGFEPNAEDQRAVAGAELIVANGLGFESWLPRLVEAAGFQGRMVVASDGIAPLPWPGEEDAEHGHDGVDPHAFQDAQLVLTYVDNIAAGLAAIRPDAVALFEANATALKAEFTGLDAELKASLGALPAAHRRILTSHGAFGYFGRAYGIDFVGLQAAGADSEPTAQDLRHVIEEIRAGGIRAVFLENMSDPRFVEALAADTGVKIGGQLYADALSGEGGPAPDLLSLFRHNQSELLKALR